jgi:uncharacterized protein
LPAKPIDRTTARRFVLGLQGLWPGRRWHGRDGLVAAVDQSGSIQVDPLDVVGHSQDLALNARVDGYRPADLDRALYRDRTLFEWGGNLQIYPVTELPYLRAQMRVADYLGRRARFERSHGPLLETILAEIESRGPLGSRDLAGGTAVESYRARRDTGVALFYLWWRGDLMIEGRTRGERRYDLTERVVPARLLREPAETDAEPHRIARGMRHYGLPNAVELYAIQRRSTVRPVRARHRAAWIRAEERAGRIAPVRVEGWKGKHWVDPAMLPQLRALGRGEVPAEWGPRPDGESEEATFLAPLEIVSARGRAARLFDFEYVWEVYKPAPKRRWGYYTLPILHGDRLRARADLKFDRPSRALRVLGFWLEPETSPGDVAFARAVGRGLERLRRMTGAERLDLGGLRPPGFRSRVRQPP